MEKYDVIILGAGASGCICALEAAKQGKQVLIVDKSPFAAKKLLATGNGRCNLTFDKSISYGDYNQNIEKYFDVLSPAQTIEYFENLGLVCYSDDEGRVYPISNSAKSVVDVIGNALASHNNIKQLLSTEILDVDKKENFIVTTNQGKFYCENLVIALGGNNEEIYKKFNIVISPYLPSLVALKTQSTRSLEGLRLSSVNIKIFDKKQLIFNEIGEILFKDSGISGILAFNASSIFARKGSYNGELVVDILPKMEHGELVNLLKKRKKMGWPINKMFDGMFLPQVGYYILNECKIDENRKVDKLNDEEIERLARSIKNLTFKVKSHYENNQVYSGGIKLNQLDNNLQSKKVKGLYFCGEICDVDGKCGGYNLQWAWTSGYIVGKSIC